MKYWLVEKNVILLKNIKRVSLDDKNAMVVITYLDGEEWSYKTAEGNLESEFANLIQMLGEE